MTLVDIHARLANTALFYAIIMALWGILRFLRKEGVGGSYWGALVIAEILFLIQAGLGVTLLLSGSDIGGQGIHILYGVVSVLVLPGIFTFTRGDDVRRAMLVYGVGFLFLVGILIRAISTGP
ncbi:MAG: hypothetical protein GX495_11670 [Chloroflexi bacterium]|jgi:heme A synthase|nr:hypothetical protein [Chloroflexota bacterium]